MIQEELTHTSRLLEMKRLIVLLSLISFTLGINAKHRPQVTLHTTEGDITIELYKETPIHSANFLRLAKEGKLNGQPFDRVIKNFMIQCGTEEEPDIVPGEIVYPKYYHKRGAVATTREGLGHDLKTSTLGFYIVWGDVCTDKVLHRADSLMGVWTPDAKHIDPKLREYYKINPGTPHLDGSFTVFGEVVKGLDVVGRIQEKETDKNDKPLKPVRVITAEIKE